MASLCLTILGLIKMIGLSFIVTMVRTFKDVESSYVLHENDHLDGILFTDRILEQGGTILKETKDGLVPVEM